MIDKILHKLGYVKGKYRDLSKEPFTESELSKMMSDIVYVEDIAADKVFDQKLFQELKGIEGLVEYLRIMTERDIHRYFNAQTPQEQLIARGAFVRAHYLKSKIMGEQGSEASKLDGVRYD